jgi:hypothetical protein
VIGEIYRPMRLAESRRLVLAAKAAGISALILPADAAQRMPLAPAAWTRWQVTPLPGTAFGTPRWRLELIRSRAHQTGIWDVDWHGKTLRFLEVSATAARPARARLAV